MPLGLVRLNERRQRPNQNISFIKVMDGPEKEIAEDILERVAAIVWPIMRDNGLGVMSLEDFPPNREFWGRNFNAGECIQLVLKSPTTGLWLPFSFVCKVMLHELAHIKQMNHSRAFHAVRIGYHKEFDGEKSHSRAIRMLILATALVARGYTGEGFWSRGHTISEGLTAPRHLSEAEMPDNLCGGTYRSAKKPEKRKLTYAERKEKRKQRLFGKGEGEQMGANEKLRAALEKGKSKKAVAVKPRVTQSKRGRDLRLEAALRREAALKSESAASTSNGGNKEESDTEELSSEYETEEEEETVDVGGGNRMVRIASEGQDDDEWAEFKEEMNTMCSATALEGNKASSSMADSSRKRRNRAPDGNGTASSRPKRQLEDASDTEESDSEEIVFVTSKKVDNGRKMAVKAEEAEPKRDEDVLPSTSSSLGKARNLNEETQSFGKAPKSSPTEENGSSARVNALKSEGIEGTLSATSSPVSSESTATSTLRTGDAIACSVCTMENASSLALCAVCGNVLNRNRTPHWACSSKACRETGYSNPNDAVICGCCGERRPA